MQSQFLGGVDDRDKELGQLVSKYRIPVVEPDLRPIVQGGVAAGADQGLCEERFHHRIIRAVGAKVVHPAELGFDLVIVHALRGGADGVANEATEETA